MLPCAQNVQLHAVNGGWYVLTSNNDLYSWVGSYDASVTGANQVANFNTTQYSNAQVYTTPSLLFDANGQAPAVVATVNASGQVTLTPNAAFVGTVLVTAIASDGAESTSTTFPFTVTNQPPVLPTINTLSSGASTGTTIPLNATDGDGNTLQVVAIVSGNSPLYSLQQQYGLTTADVYDNLRLQGEKYFQSTNGSNAAHGGYFVLTSSNELFAWDGVSYATSVGSDNNLVANFNLAPYSANVYANTSLLYTAAPTNVSDVSATTSGTTINLAWLSGFIGTFQVTLDFSDGAAEVEQAFYVTVT